MEEDDPADVGASSRSPNSNRGRQRQRAAPNKPFKDWNSQTTSGTLQEYDALRDPHCRFTKQKQFKKQYEEFAQAQMIADVLRGDHASLLDVITPKQRRPKPRQKRTKGARGTRGRTRGKKHGAAGPRRRNKRTVRDSSGYGVEKRRTKTLPGIKAAAGGGKRRQRNEQSRTNSNSSLPRAPSNRREHSVGAAPPLPSMMHHNNRRSNSQRNAQRQRNERSNGSWKRTGGSTAVNDAVLKYRGKRMKGRDNNERNERNEYRDRVHVEYRKKRSENHRYSTQVRRHAYKSATLPPVPDQDNPRRHLSGQRRQDKERGEQDDSGTRAEETPQVDSPPARNPEGGEREDRDGARDGAREEQGEKVVQLPPSAMLARPDGVVASMMGSDDVGMRRKGRGGGVDMGNSGMGNNGMGNNGLGEEGNNNRLNISSMFENDGGNNDTVSSSFFQDATALKPAPSSPGSPGDDYSDDDFDDDDFEDEEEEQAPANTPKTATDNAVAIEKTIEPTATLPNVQKETPTPTVTPPPVTLQDVERAIPSRFKGAISQLMYNTMFSDTYNKSKKDLQTLSKLIGTFKSDQKAVATSMTSLLQQRSIETVQNTWANLGQTIDCGLLALSEQLNAQVDAAESDIGSQKRALHKVLNSEEAKQAFEIVKIPLMVVHAMPPLPLLTEKDTTNTAPRPCVSLDNIVRTTATSLLRSDADASGDERCDEFIQLLGARLLLPTKTTKNTTATISLTMYQSLLSPSTKGAVVALLWQACHGSDRGTKDTPGSGQGTRRLRCVVGRPSTIQDSYQWASTAQPLSWVPGTEETGRGCWDRRLSSQLLFPYFKRAEHSSAKKGNSGVISGGVEEGEGSGPRKEFFNLMGQQLMSKVGVECVPFTYIQTNESYWVAASQESGVHRWIGMLMGLALTSRCHLGANLSLYLFKCLMSTSPGELPVLSMFDAAEIQPELIDGFRSLQQMDAQAFRDYVDMEGGDTSVSKEQVSVCVSLLPNNRTDLSFLFLVSCFLFLVSCFLFLAWCFVQYFQNEINERIVHPVQSALLDLRLGFQAIVSIGWLTSIGIAAQDLKVLVCGSIQASDHPFNIRELFRIRTDDDVKECPELLSTLFDIVGDMNGLDKRMFLKFVTGIDKLPLPMSETIKIDSPFMCFSDEEHTMNLMRLPTAHTCFNTIELPNYVASLLELHYQGQSLDDLESDEKTMFLARLTKHMKEKLLLAVLNTDGSGYGLDEGVGRNRELIQAKDTEEEQETRHSVVIVRETTTNKQIQEKKEEEVKVEYTKEQTPREETPREETPRDEDESDASYDIPGLSDSDDLDDLFDGFD